MDHHHYASPMISPTAHFALNTAVRGKDTLDFLGHYIWLKMTNSLLTINNDFHLRNPSKVIAYIQ